MSKKIYALFVAVCTSVLAFGQVGQGTLSGKIIDKETGEPLPFVNVAIYKGDQQIKGATSDFDGKYTIKPIDPGPYDVQASFVGYTPKRIEGVVVASNRITFQDIKMTAGVELDVVEIVQYKKPLINKDGGATGGSVTSEEINKMPTRSAAGIATTVGGVSTAGTGGQISIRGGRTDGDFVYIDGVKVRGSSNLPKSALQEVNVITGGVPANYGDATGGIISITTRGPASTFNAGVELISSGFQLGDQRVNMLDPFGQNIMEASLSGPLLRRRKEDGSKGEPLIGYRISGNYTSNLDGRPSAIGHNVITEEARQALIDQPFRRTDGGDAGAVIYNADFLRSSDFQNQAFSNNTAEKDVSLSGRLTFDLGGSMDLSVGGRLAYQQDRQFSLSNQFANWENNALVTNLDYNTYIRFSQRFLENAEEESTVKNVYYSVMLDYSKETGRFENEQHGEDFYSYGYKGKYNVFRDTFQFGSQAFYDSLFVDGDTLFNVLLPVQDAIAGDTLVTFEASDKNPVLANYVDAYYSLFDRPDGSYESLDQLAPSGLRNGDSPNRIITNSNGALINNLGTPVAAFQKIDNSQFRLTASGSADIGNHAVVLGMEFEQRVDRNWTIQNLSGITGAQRANSIWAISRQRANNHIQELNSDSTIIPDGNGGYLVYYGTNVDKSSQSTFDRNLRASLGLDPNGTDFINVDALDPSQLSIDFFSADELLNNGNRLVNHRGFDIHGNRYNGNASVEDFFSLQDENGDFLRPVNAFQPVYAAGYIMDKFTFDDIIFNVGVRVDRFDANQAVLKDDYLFRDAYTAGEVRQLQDQSGLSSQEISTIPGAIGDDFHVYVDDINDPESILGFKDSKGNFYNAQGQLTEAELIRAPDGKVTPLLKDRTTSDQVVAADAFEDYKAQVNVMPRVAFSFPISDVALFFAHYDILTRRPFSSNQLDLVRYQYITSVNAGIGNPISNPNLLPEKTVDYAFGFQQALTNSSALKVEAFYREMRDQIQRFQYVGAYPQDYFSFANIDFGTVKGLTIEYDLRATGNLGMNFNYTLQFADGTGSSAGGQAVNLNGTGFETLRIIAPLNRDRRHQFNARVDFRYGEGKNYNGPVIGGKDILSNFGANAVLNVGSGTPYSATTNPDPNRSPLEGTINGSRLPWFYTVNLVLDKSFTLGGKKQEAETGASAGINMNVFLLVNNLFDTRNVVGVYRATGNPTDDGYLADARFQNNIRSANDEQSFRDLYSLSLQNPGFFGAPRTVQLGVRFDF